MKYLCDTDEIEAGRGKEIVLRDDDGRPLFIALFSTSEGIRAWANVCPHQGRSLSWSPDSFLFSDDGRLICPHHGASFNLVSGLCTGGPCVGASLTPIAVVTRDGQLFLDA